MDREVLAYLAGAMDSDGYFGIKRNTYAMRVRGDATQAVFSERAGLKQVTPQIPELLKSTFGGRLALDAPNTARGRPLWGWQVTDRQAAGCAAALLPFLRIKEDRAALLLDLRRSKEGRFGAFAFWWERAHPDWRDMPMMSFDQAARRMNYRSVAMVGQAVRNGSLLALPHLKGTAGRERIPRDLVDAYVIHCSRSRDGRGRCRPLELMEWRERLCAECRELNRIGTGKHPITERSGPYLPAA